MAVSFVAANAAYQAAAKVGGAGAVDAAASAGSTAGLGSFTDALASAVKAAEKVDESKMDEKEKTRRRMLRAAGIDPDKKKDEPKPAAPAGAMPATSTAPGVPNEYTFNITGMM